MPRKKLNKVKTPNYSVDPITPSKIAQLARSVGYCYGSTGHVGAFLDDLVNVNPSLLELIIKNSKGTT